jgi:membrane protein implicated in regulation of membrane protease activity
MWSPQVLGKYVLLQLPSLTLIVALAIILHEYFDFPLFYTWAVVAGWVMKDVILYPFVWPAYDSRPQEPLVGLIGNVKEWIDASGYVEVKGELWRAEAAGACPGIKRGDVVEVREVRGLTLIVEARADEAEEVLKKRTLGAELPYVEDSKERLSGHRPP